LVIGFPRQGLYGHLIYADGYGVGKSKRCNTDSSSEKIDLKAIFPPAIANSQAAKQPWHGAMNP
jgi:hypothetical protein